MPIADKLFRAGKAFYPSAQAKLNDSLIKLVLCRLETDRNPSRWDALYTFIAHRAREPLYQAGFTGQQLLHHALFEPSYFCQLIR